MATLFKSGKNAVCTINGTRIPLMEFSVTGQPDSVEFTNSETGNIPRNEATFLRKQVVITYDFDFNGTPWGSPISVFDGAVLTNVLCYLSGTSGLNWNFTSLYVENADQTVSVTGKPQQKLTCKLNGPYTPPGGTLQGTTGN